MTNHANAMLHEKYKMNTKGSSGLELRLAQRYSCNTVNSERRCKPIIHKITWSKIKVKLEKHRVSIQQASCQVNTLNYNLTSSVVGTTALFISTEEQFRTLPETPKTV